MEKDTIGKLIKLALDNWEYILSFLGVTGGTITGKKYISKRNKTRQDKIENLESRVLQLEILLKGYPKLMKQIENKINVMEDSLKQLLAMSKAEHMTIKKDLEVLHHNLDHLQDDISSLKKSLDMIINNLINN